jgi:accessory gene regulator B
MIGKKAAQLSAALARRGIIKAEDTDVYAYGLELMLSTTINILLVIVVSFLLNRPLSWLFFLLPFIPLRLTAGGYHAKTHLGCCATFTLGYAALLAAGILVSGLVTPLILTIVSIACFMLNLLLSPVPASNKPLNADEKRRNRSRSLVISAVCLLVTASVFFAGAGLMPLYIWFVLGQLGAAVSLIAAKLVRG